MLQLLSIKVNDSQTYAIYDPATESRSPTEFNLRLFKHPEAVNLYEDIGWFANLQLKPEAQITVLLTFPSIYESIAAELPEFFI